MNAVTEFGAQVEECLATAELFLLRHFDLLSAAEGGALRLRELILSLAVQGKLVPQDAAEESAEPLLARSRTLMRAQMQSGQTKAEKPAAVLTDVEMPFQLPPGWCWCRLTDTGEYINGSAFKPTDWHVDGLPVIRIQNLSGRSTDFNRAKPDAKKSVLVEAGDILVSWSATLDAFIWKGERGLLNQHIFRVAPAPAVCKEYLYWLLKYVIQDLARSDYAHGLVMPHINRGPFLAHPIALPPLAEQRRIAERIEELTRLCDALEAKGKLEAAQHAQLLDALLGALKGSSSSEELAENWQRVAMHFDLLLDRPEAVDAVEQSILQLAVRGMLVPQNSRDESASVLLEEIRGESARERTQRPSKRGEQPVRTDQEAPYPLPPGWVWTRIDALAAVGTGTTPARDNASYFAHGAIPWVTSGETGQSFIRSTAQFVSDKALAETNLTLYPVGTLIVAMYGQGKTRGQVSELCIAATTNQACAAIVLTKKSPDHLKFIKLVFEKSYDEMRELSAGGAQPNLNLAKVKGTLIPLAPLAEQSRIVVRVEALRRLCTELRQSLTEGRMTQSHIAEVIVQMTI